MVITPDDWAARREAWSARTRLRGAERAPYHVGRRPEEFAAVQAAQWAVVEPAITRAVCDAPFARSRESYRYWLDFGCGAGRWTPWLADRYEVDVVGVDLTPELLAAAAQRLQPLRGVTHFRPFDGAIPLDTHTVDVVFAWMVLSAILDEDMLRAVTEEWRRVLRPGGLVILLDNTSKVDGRPVRSPMSVSRTVAEYRAHFTWAALQPAAQVIDLGEINTLFIGEAQ